MNDTHDHISVRDANRLPTPAAQSQFSPDEIFRRIDLVRQSFEPEPGLLAQLLSPSERKHAAALADAKVAAVHARQELIEGLAGCIKTYVDAHRGDLKVRGDAFVLETFAKLTRGLTAIVEQAYLNFLEVYSSSVNRIDLMSNLTEDMKREQKEQAYRRAQDGMRTSQARFERALDELGEQVERVLREIGS